MGNAGALECSGERRGGDHACLAALAIAAVKLERKASFEEEAAITRILVKSGIIRDSLVSVPLADQFVPCVWSKVSYGRDHESFIVAAVV